VIGGSGRVLPAGSVVTFLPADGSDTVVFDEMTGRVHRLGGSAATIWASIDGTRTTGEIVETVAGVYDVDAEMVAADVVGVVGRFVELGLVLFEQ